MTLKTFTFNPAKICHNKLSESKEKLPHKNLSLCRRLRKPHTSRRLLGDSEWKNVRLPNGAFCFCFRFFGGDVRSVCCTSCAAMRCDGSAIFMTIMVLMMMTVCSPKRGKVFPEITDERGDGARNNFSFFCGGRFAIVHSVPPSCELVQIKHRD